MSADMNDMTDNWWKDYLAGVAVGTGLTVLIELILYMTGVV